MQIVFSFNILLQSLLLPLSQEYLQCLYPYGSVPGCLQQTHSRFTHTSRWHTWHTKVSVKALNVNTLEYDLLSSLPLAQDSGIGPNIPTTLHRTCSLENKCIIFWVLSFVWLALLGQIGPIKPQNFVPKGLGFVTQFLANSRQDLMLAFLKIVSG